MLMDPWGDTLDSIPGMLGSAGCFLSELYKSDRPENLCFEGRGSKPDLLPTCSGAAAVMCHDGCFWLRAGPLSAAFVHIPGTRSGEPVPGEVLSPQAEKMSTFLSRLLWPWANR